MFFHNENGLPGLKKMWAGGSRLLKLKLELSHCSLRTHTAGKSAVQGVGQPEKFDDREVVWKT